MIESVVRERQQSRLALSISGLSSWGEGCLALSQGTVKEVQLCGACGWGDGCSLDMLNIPCLGDSNTYYQNDLGELT